MTVQELIDLLKTENPEANVCFNAERAGRCYDVDEAYSFTATNEIILTGEEQ